MTESVKMKAPAHYLRVDLGDPGEAEYWVVVLDASRRQLEAAIAAVGCDALDVRAWLDDKALAAPPHAAAARHPR
jgi:hypothetical protein